MEGDEENDQAMDFVEGIHELYDNKRRELEVAYLDRKIKNKILLKAMKNKLLEEKKTLSFIVGRRRGLALDPIKPQSVSVADLTPARSRYSSISSVASPPKRAP